MIWGPPIWITFLPFWPKPGQNCDQTRRGCHNEPVSPPTERGDVPPPGGCRKPARIAVPPVGAYIVRPAESVLFFFRFPANSQCLPPAGRHMGSAPTANWRDGGVFQKSVGNGLDHSTPQAASATISQSYNTVPVGARTARRKAFCFVRFAANSQCLPAGRHMGLPLRQIGEMVRNIPEKRREWPWPFRPTDAGSATISQSYNTVPHAVGGAHCAPGGKAFCFFAFRRIRAPTSGQTHGSALRQIGEMVWNIPEKALGMVLTIPPRRRVCNHFPILQHRPPRRRGAQCAPGGKAFLFFRFPANSQRLPAGRHMGLPLRQIGEMVRNIPESVGNGLDHSASQAPGLQPFPNPTTPSPTP